MTLLIAEKNANIFRPNLLIPQSSPSTRCMVSDLFNPSIRPSVHSFVRPFIRPSIHPSVQVLDIVMFLSHLICSELSHYNEWSHPSVG